MNIEWDYSYYQPWSDNEWLVDEMLVMLDKVSQTSFGHIFISSSTIPTVSMAPKSPWKDLLINTSHVLKQSVMAEILGRSTGNYYGTVY